MKEMNLKTVSSTPRDLLLLEGLYDFTVMSFFQIREKFFNGKSIPTASNRLSKLEKGGMIKSFRVPKFSNLLDKPSVSVLFQITREGIRELQKRNFNEVLREEPIRLHGHSIEHDVLLTNVIGVFKDKFPGSKVTHGKLVCEKEVASGLNPDAILVKPDGKTRYAIELELTLKSESRYREIVMRYRLANTISKVIYVTGHRAIREKLSKVLGGIPQSVNGKVSFGKFSFISLEDLNDDQKGIFSHGQELLTKEVGA